MRREEALAILRREKPRLMEKYGVTAIGLFGSTARDEARPDSDVDVIVEMEPDLFRLVHVADDLEVEFGAKVDIVIFDEGLRPFFLERLKRDGVYV